MRSFFLPLLSGALLGAALLLPQAVAAAPASGPVDAVRQVNPAYPQQGCGALSGRLAGCPVTPRLRARLNADLRWQQAHTRGGNGNAFCRCQNPPQRVQYRLASNNGSRALVVTTQRYGANNTFHLTWIVLRRHGSWQVDDQFCSGHPATSLYAPGNYSPRPCPEM